MTETVSQRVSRYILDGTDQDLRRLLSLAETFAESARAALVRAGVQPGWTVIDCGCGPLGALAVLADIVGPAGHVVGVDSNPAAVQRARAVVSALELGNADLVAGDLHDMDSAALGGPFDLAFTRCFLVHQADPVRTLRHIAGLLSPGGLVVAQEPLRNPAPRAHPHVPAAAEAWDLIQEVRDRAGLPPEAVESLPRTAREAGLEVAALHGFFLPSEDPQELDVGAALITATKERGVQLGIAADRFDDLTRQIQAAKATHEWGTGAFMLNLTLRKPAEA